MDSTSIVGSSQESAGGEVVGDTVRKPMKSEDDRIDMGSPEITVKRPDRTTTIPDVCYCGSCKSLYFSRRMILGQCCSDYAGGKESASRKGKITELTEDCNLEEFLNWFLPRVLVDEDSKYFCDELFYNICEEKLLGAPMN